VCVGVGGCVYMSESEYHFLMVCPKFTDLRKKYSDSYFCHWPSMQLYIQQFEDTLSQHSKIITNYIRKVHFRSRKEKELRTVFVCLFVYLFVCNMFTKLRLSVNVSVCTIIVFVCMAKTL
jgi:hypothetical protein